MATLKELRKAGKVKSPGKTTTYEGDFERKGSGTKDDPLRAVRQEIKDDGSLGEPEYSGEDFSFSSGGGSSGSQDSVQPSDSVYVVESGGEQVRVSGGVAERIRELNREAREREERLRAEQLVSQRFSSSSRDLVRTGREKELREQARDKAFDDRLQRSNFLRQFGFETSKEGALEIAQADKAVDLAGGSLKLLGGVPSYVAGTLIQDIREQAIATQANAQQAATQGISSLDTYDIVGDVQTGVNIAGLYAGGVALSPKTSAARAPSSSPAPKPARIGFEAKNVGSGDFMFNVRRTIARPGATAPIYNTKAVGEIEIPQIPVKGRPSKTKFVETGEPSLRGLDYSASRYRTLIEEGPPQEIQKLLTIKDPSLPNPKTPQDAASIITGDKPSPLVFEEIKVPVTRKAGDFVLSQDYSVEVGLVPDRPLPKEISLSRFNELLREAEAAKYSDGTPRIPETQATLEVGFKPSNKVTSNVETLDKVDLRPPGLFGSRGGSLSVGQRGSRPLPKLPKPSFPEFSSPSAPSSPVVTGGKGVYTPPIITTNLRVFNDVNLPSPSRVFTESPTRFDVGVRPASVPDTVLEPVITPEEDVVPRVSERTFPERRRRSRGGLEVVQKTSSKVVPVVTPVVAQPPTVGLPRQVVTPTSPPTIDLIEVPTERFFPKPKPFPTPENRVERDLFRVRVGSTRNKVFKDFGVGGVGLVSRARDFVLSSPAATVRVERLGGGLGGLNRFFRGDVFRSGGEGVFVQKRGKRILSRAEQRSIARFKFPKLGSKGFGGSIRL